MKNILTVCCAFLLLLPSCKKKSGAPDDTAVALKYAKYEISVKKDRELKQWLATLSRAEDVSLISQENITAPDGRKIDISKIKLADDSVGYIESKHLADSPVVFTEDTKGFIRPTAGAPSDLVIPKGTLAFIIEEKGLWVQVYIGKLSGKSVKDQWVEAGYSSDKKIIMDAKEYESAVEKLSGRDEAKIAEAKTTLNKLAEGTSVIADLAKEKLGIYGGPAENYAPVEEPGTDPENPAAP